MIRKECKTIRQAIDESSPAQDLSAKVVEHLRGCAECRTFESEERALQGLIASLGTVAAPADFDFRLRARLAREKSAIRNGGSFARFLKVPLAVAALVLLLAVGGIVIKNWVSSSGTPAQIAGSTLAPSPDQTAEKTNLPVAGREEGGAAGHTTVNQDKASTAVATPRVPGKRNNSNRNNSFVARKGGATATRDMTLSSAAVVESNQSENADPVVRIPLNEHGFRISIDDGHGTPRTVSLPTVSFGSERLMTSNPFMPTTMSSSKGVWW